MIELYLFAAAGGRQVVVARSSSSQARSSTERVQWMLLLYEAFRCRGESGGCGGESLLGQLRGMRVHPLMLYHPARRTPATSAALLIRPLFGLRLYRARWIETAA